MTSSIRRRGFLLALGMWAAVTCAHAQEATGILVVKVKNAATTTHLSKRLQKHFTNAGFDWGIADGKMVFTLVGVRFVNLHGAHFTRFGTMETVRVAPGEYKISCVGFIDHGGLFSDKAFDPMGELHRAAEVTGKTRAHSTYSARKAVVPGCWA